MYIYTRCRFSLTLNGNLRTGSYSWLYSFLFFSPVLISPYSPVLPYSHPSPGSAAKHRNICGMLFVVVSWGMHGSWSFSRKIYPWSRPVTTNFCLFYIYIFFSPLYNFFCLQFYLFQVFTIPFDVKNNKISFIKILMSRRVMTLSPMCFTCERGEAKKGVCINVIMTFNDPVGNSWAALLEFWQRLGLEPGASSRSTRVRQTWLGRGILAASSQPHCNRAHLALYLAFEAHLLSRLPSSLPPASSLRHFTKLQAAGGSQHRGKGVSEWAADRVETFKT